jgi:hypothetical protein
MKTILFAIALLLASGTRPVMAATTDWHLLIGTWTDPSDQNCIIMIGNGSVASEHCMHWNFVRLNHPYPEEAEFVAKDGTLCRVTMILPITNRLVIQTAGRCGNYSLVRVK